MAFWLSGLDEAGYGPMLGPLVISLVTLESDRPFRPAEPWKRLAPVVTHRKGKRGFAVADSKKLHRPSTDDLSPLERGVLAFVASERGGAIPGTFRELVDHLTEGRSAYLDRYPWYRGQDLDLPVSVSSLNLQGSIRRLARRLEAGRLRVSEVRSIPLEVQEFNDELERRSTKGEVNAWAMGRFIRWLWQRRDRARMEVWSDRLGGRQRYGPLLFPLFPGARFQIVEQGQREQSYRVEEETSSRSLQIHFRAEGEELCFATALASMTSKYLRELHMRLFNRWWRAEQPDLRPTAGYPQDARRFLADSDGTRRRLGVEGQLLVRRR